MSDGAWLLLALLAIMFAVLAAASLFLPPVRPPEDVADERIEGLEDDSTTLGEGDE